MSEFPTPPEKEDKAAARGPAASGVGSSDLPYQEFQRITFRAIFLIAALFLIYQLASPLTTLLLFFLLVFILAAVLNPVVVRLQRLGIPRVISAAGLVFFFVSLLALLGWLVLPPLLQELTEFLTRLGKSQGWLIAAYQYVLRRYPYLAQLIPDPGTLFHQFAQSMGPVLGRVGRHTINAAIGLVSLLLLLVLLIFTLARPEPLLTTVLSVVAKRYQERVVTVLRRSLQQLQAWALASLILGLIVGTMSGIGLRLLGVPQALLFGVIAGIGEVIPNIGPILSAIPPMLMALTIDPLLALWVALLFIGVQQLENSLIVPLVMGQSLRLHPVSVTFAILMMGALFGFLGAILAVPVCAIVKICWEELYLLPRHIDAEALQAVAHEIVSGSRSEARSPGADDPSTNAAP